MVIDGNELSLEDGETILQGPPDEVIDGVKLNTYASSQAGPQASSSRSTTRAGAPSPCRRVVAATAGRISRWPGVYLGC